MIAVFGELLLQCGHRLAVVSKKMKETTLQLVTGAELIISTALGYRYALPPNATLA